MIGRNILGHTVVQDTARQRVLAGLQAEAQATAPFCCGPCSKDQHDRCLSSQPCDCAGCAQARATAAKAVAPVEAHHTSGLPSRSVLRARGRQGML